MIRRKLAVILVLNLIYIQCSGYKSYGYPKKYCLAVDNNPYMSFGSKSPYENVRSTAGSDSVCEPVQIWSFHRHGTRYPSPADIELMKSGEDMRNDILAFYSSGQSLPPDPLCDNDLDNLKGWKWDPTIQQQAYFLTEQGWEEMTALAERFKRRYPMIFDGNYSADDYYFRHTIEQRTTASCIAFIEGLFGNETASKVQIEIPLEKDPLIRPYDMCDAWQQEVNHNPERWQEAKTFKKSDDYLQLLQDVSVRLGYNRTLKSEEIDGMYNNCRFRQSWYPFEVSPWCAVFNKIELLLLDYLDDLTGYYKSGYGHRYNPKLGCMPLQHLMENFDKTIQESQAIPKAIHLFSHDTLLNMMFTAMGYSQDQTKLKGKNYEDFLINRLFRSSLNAPFAANVAAVLHKCSNDYEDYQVQFFINERPMQIDGCEFGLCSWSYLKNYYGPAMSCNLNFCKNEVLPMASVFPLFLT